MYVPGIGPPTPDTMTATHATQPIIIIKESVYIFEGYIGSGGIDYDITLFIRDIYWMGAVYLWNWNKV